MSNVWVIDANVVVRACLELEGFAPLSGLALAAPHLVISESLNALREGMWRGEISPELARQARLRLREIPVDLHPSAELIDRAWEIAQTLGWAKTYDAEYVALAQLLGCALITLDARLVRGAGHLVRIVGPTEI